jgi:hypothetical protein
MDSLRRKLEFPILAKTCNSSVNSISLNWRLIRVSLEVFWGLVSRWVPWTGLTKKTRNSTAKNEELGLRIFIKVIPI